MKNDQFLDLLKDSNALIGIPLDDLEVLYAKYPFSKNIQILYNKKRSLLGLTQNKLPMQKLRAQHNHPVLLEHILYGKSAEDYESINTVYDSIFEKIESESRLPGESEETSIQELPKEIPSAAMDIEDIEQTQVATEVDAVVQQSAELELVDIETSLESKKRNKEAKQLKNIQFEDKEPNIQDSESEPKKSERENIKFIEVGPFNLSNKSKVKSKKQDKSKAKKQKGSKKKKQAEKSNVKTEIKTKKKKKQRTAKKKTTIKKVQKKKTVKENVAQELDYSSWLDSLRSTKELLEGQTSLKKKTTKKKPKASKKSIKKARKQNKKGKLQDKIDRSLQRNTNIYTETLAHLMEKQGHKKQAVEIYEQLMINNPEKSDYFANRIQKLK